MGEELFHTERQTDMTKLTVAFRNFSNAHENGVRSTVNLDMPVSGTVGSLPFEGVK